MNEPAPKELNALQHFRMLLDKMKPQFERALPPHIKVEKFTRTIETALQLNPSLLPDGGGNAEIAELERSSLLAECQRCANDGLIPDGKEAAITNFSSKLKLPGGKEIRFRKAQYMPMVRGLLKLVRNSGEIAAIAVGTVRKNDLFDAWTDDLGDHVTHRPDHFGDRGEIIGYFAMARTKDGGTYVKAFNLAQIAQRRAVSRSADSEYGPWVKWPEEMGQKTVLRALANILPLSSDTAEVFSRDDAMYDLSTLPETPPTDAPARPKPTGPQRLDALRAPVDGGGEVAHEVAPVATGEGGEVAAF